MTLITPKNAIDLVLAKKTRDATFQPYETKIQKYCLLFSIASLSIGILFGLATHIWQNKFLLFGALILMLTSSLFAMFYQLASILPDLAKFRNIEREISTPFSSRFNNDIDLINELSQTCEIHHLSFARANFVLMAKQLRERIGILVGALEKIGLIPLLTSAYFAFMKFKKEGLEPFSGIDWVFTVFAFLYILAVRMTGTAQWMEKISEIYDQAIALKLRREG
jgi:hypothetical protein